MGDVFPSLALVARFTLLHLLDGPILRLPVGGAGTRSLAAMKIHV
jgi:hypothetical protein